MTRIEFERVTCRARKRGRCSRCGKTHVRTKVFEQTVNPWNITPHSEGGRPKTRDEVWDAVLAETRAWEQEKGIEPCQPR